jgi:adenylate cyclase
MPPDRLAELMNVYRGAISEAAHRHDVDNDEIRADSMMCVWMASEHATDVRLTACLAAFDVLDAVGRFNQAYAPIQLPTRIGVDAGQIYVGQQGGVGRWIIGAEGEAANTAARIESLSKHLGTHLLASSQVVDGLDVLLTRPVGTFLLVGKSEPIRVHEIVARRDQATAVQRSLCARFASAVAAFEAGDAARAAVLFEALLADFPDDGPTRFLLRHCRRAAAAGEVSPIIRMDVK